MTTIHAYTQDQNLQDAPHKDLRRARAAAINLVPDVDRRREGDRPRPPRAQGEGRRHLGPRARGDRFPHRPRRLARSRDVVRRGPAAYRTAAAGPLEGLLQYSEDPLVSTDIVGNPHSCIYDSELTMVHGRTVKVFGWYDNEWGYSCRLVDLIGKLLP